MLNLSLSIESIRKIYDFENRKGKYLESLYFPDAKEVSKKIKSNHNEYIKLKKSRSNFTKEKYNEFRKKNRDERAVLIKEREACLNSEIEKIFQNITGNRFKISIAKTIVPNNKAGYVVDQNDSAVFFAIKQVQYDIYKAYSVKQGDRYNIVSQLKSLLSRQFPFTIIRTDIKEFYETIPHANLIYEITRDGLLNPLSIRVINKIIREYKNYGNDRGIPRGIGISAYLAEIYMRSFDEKIKANPEVVYYSRYVDDIIIVYITRTNNHNCNYINNISELLSNYHLTINMDKTTEISIDSNLSQKEFEYLGYKFSFEKNNLRLSLSDKKIIKYENKIQLMMKAYSKQKMLNEKRARKILLKRIKFLTGNFKLSNNKSNALTGIYFSNSLLDNMDCLERLDLFLQEKLFEEVNNKAYLKKLETYKFRKGWELKSYHTFSPNEFVEIVKVWKNL